MQRKIFKQFNKQILCILILFVLIYIVLLLNISLYLFTATFGRLVTTLSLVILMFTLVSPQTFLCRILSYK